MDMVPRQEERTISYICWAAMGRAREMEATKAKARMLAEKRPVSLLYVSSIAKAFIPHMQLQTRRPRYMSMGLNGAPPPSAAHVASSTGRVWVVIWFHCAGRRASDGASFLVHHEALSGVGRLGTNVRGTYGRFSSTMLPAVMRSICNEVSDAAE